LRLPPRTRPDSGFPVLPAVDRLDEVTGIGREAAIIAEIGLLMSTFPTAAHLVSWAKLSPRTIQSGAKNRSGKTGKGNHYAFTGSWLGDHMITKSTPPIPGTSSTQPGGSHPGPPPGCCRRENGSA